MLRVLIAAAELELVPEEVAGHPQIRLAAKKIGKRPMELLLDQNGSQQACRKLEDGAKRGRPDIIHYTLLSLLESPLNKQGGLEVAIHTRHGQLIRIRSDTRLPRGEARFQGLLSKVLQTGRSNDDPEPLLRVETTCTPTDAIARFAKGKVVRLDPAGERVDARQLRATYGPDATFVIGGFAHGTFSDEWQEAVPTTVSIWPEELNAWAVAAEIAAGWRE